MRQFIPNVRYSSNWDHDKEHPLSLSVVSKIFVINWKLFFQSEFVVHIKISFKSTFLDMSGTTRVACSIRLIGIFQFVLRLLGVKKLCLIWVEL